MMSLVTFPPARRSSPAPLRASSGRPCCAQQSLALMRGLQMVLMCDLVGGPEKNPSRELAADKLGLTSVVPGRGSPQQQQDGATQVSVRQAVVVPTTTASCSITATAALLQDHFSNNIYCSFYPWSVCGDLSA